MSHVILEHSSLVRTRDGEVFTPVVLGQEMPDGNWIGWIEFVSDAGKAAKLRTERETTQPNRQALDYWATGLEPVYIEGAFERARSLIAGNQ